MIPQIIYLIVTLLGLGIIIAKHGQPQKNYNAITSLIAFALTYALLYWGGFFDVFFK